MQCEQCAVRVARDVSTGGIQVFVTLPRHGRAIVRTVITPGMQLAAMPHHEQHIGALVVHIEATRSTLDDAVLMTQQHIAAHCYIAQA